MYKQETKIPELNWQPYQQMLMTSMPQAVRERLLDQSSTTCYLQNTGKKNVQVEVLNSGWLYAKPDEAERLGIYTCEKAWVREVYVRCDSEVYVYAWSVFPESTLTGKYKGLQRLGSKSLVNLLFNDPDIRRTGLEIAQIAPVHPLYHKATWQLPTKPEQLWARRYCFMLKDKPLLINEVFLPTAFEQVAG